MLSLRLKITKIDPSTTTIIALNTAIGSQVDSNAVNPQAPVKLSLKL